MKLSIITINYNDFSGLEKTIKSVIAQTFKDFQYIVIDGGSTDGSKEILEKYRNFLDIAVSEKDNGIYNAMNKGAAYATGEYLLFLNSGDELFDETTLENVCKKEISADIVCGRVLNYSEKDSYIKIPPKVVTLYTFIGGSLPHPSAFIKRSLFQKVGGYSEAYRIISDWCFFVEATLIERCSYSTIADIITRFNRFGLSSTAGHTEEMAKMPFLKNLFGDIICDYLPVKDEAISNYSFWVSQQKGFIGILVRLPFKILNRVLGLRNRLSRRMGLIKQ